LSIDTRTIDYHHRGFFSRLPSSPHDLTSRITPIGQAIVLCHLGVPRLSETTWELIVEGLVETPLTLSMKELLAVEKVEIESVHQCAGSPLRPDEASQRVCNVVWGGAPLSRVLEGAGVRPEANFIWSHGADSGRFGDLDCGPYVKDLPLSRLGRDVLLAYEMNGEKLLPEHGHPVRLVVPGYYGTNSVKWLKSITLAADRPDSVFTRKWYLDPDEHGDRNIPVWQTGPQSIIVSPQPGRADLPANEPTEIWGWAWGDDGVETVDVSTDGGIDWETTSLDRATGHGWRRFRRTWTPASPGDYRLSSRATTRGGDVQPSSGRRNAIYSVGVTAREP